MKVLNISHDKCLDGYTSAWLVRRAYCAPTDKVTTIFCHAGAPLPPVPEERFDLILVTDTSFKPEELERLRLQGPVVVLDHHETAIKRLADTKWDAYLSTKMSGALLTYHYLLDHGEKLPPEAFEMANYVSDGDLWEFRLPNSRKIKAYLQHVVQKPEDVGRAALSLLTSMGSCIMSGGLLLDVVERQINEALDRAHTVMIGGYDGIPCVNSSVERSEIGHVLAKQSPHGFSVVWWYELGKVRLSFRAVDDSGKCLEIAEAWGGGGHKRACGASLSYIEWDEIVSGRGFGG